MCIRDRERAFVFRLSNLGNWSIKETITPIRTEKIIANPTDTPSIFTKNKSKEIISELRFVKIKKDVTRSVNKMK